MRLDYGCRDRYITVMRIAIFLLAAVSACGNPEGPPGPGSDPDFQVVGAVDITIQTQVERTAISPFIYGSNQDRAGDVWTVRRYGGNRLTGYNWETNFSNAGSDYLHSSDRFLVSDGGVPSGEALQPARALTWFHAKSNGMGAESIITLQMAGYVS